MEKILEFFGNNQNILYTILGVGGFGALLNLILKKLVTEKFLEKMGKGIEKFGKGLGIAVTLGMTKWLKGLWNNVFEPYIVIFLKLIFQNFIAGFIIGLETDNDSLKKE